MTSVNNQKKSDEIFMAECFKLAIKARGQVSPNPYVGCVIVKGKKIIAKGSHQKLGGDHAEIDALRKLRFQAKGATLYCNLEPCFHVGKTPACVHPVIKSGVKRVVIAMKDPNPKVAGRSIRLLRQAGIQVSIGVLKKQALALNRVFVTWITQKRPYIILKAAMSLDGKITPPGQSTGWITGKPARAKVHQMRAELDGVLVGVATVINDNPQLNVRGIKGARQPYRIVLDSKGKTPLNSKLFKQSKGKSLIVSTHLSQTRKQAYEKSGALVWQIKKDRHHQIALKPLLTQLAAHNITSLLVEGGQKVLSSFYTQGLFDELVLFVAPKIFGPQTLSAFHLKKDPGWNLVCESIEQHGDDVEVRLLKI